MLRFLLKSGYLFVASLVGMSQEAATSSNISSKVKKREKKKMDLVWKVSCLDMRRQILRGGSYGVSNRLPH